MAKPSGSIYLLKNIPLSASLDNTIDFKDKDEQFSYFSSFIKYSLEKYTYVRKEREYITLGYNMNDLDDINYLMFRSENEGRLYYAFVVNKRYINPEVTELTFVIDVIQTYMFEYKWQPSYISHSHVDRWNAQHKPIYSMTDEGLDYGTEYSIESAFAIKQSERVKWLLVTMSDPSKYLVEGDFVSPTSAEMRPFAPPFACFLVPFMTDSKGIVSVFQVPSLGNNEIGDYNDLCNVMSKTSIGDNIKSISLLTYNPFLESESSSSDSFISVSFNSLVTLGLTTLGNADYSKAFLSIKAVDQSVYYELKNLAVTDWDNGIKLSMPNESEWEEVKKNPYTTPRDKRFESKLLCSPYRYNMLTDWRSNPVIYKNEYMTDDKIEIKYSFALSHNTPFRYWIKDYKRDPEGRYNCLTQPLGLDFPIISDLYAQYMLENKNTIQANLANTIISGGAMAITGAVGGAIGGGVVGAAIGGLGGVVNYGVSVVTQVNSENAKQQDIKARPDAIINSNDSTFNVLDKNAELTFYRMKICCQNEDIVAHIFNMQGYKINKIDIPNTKSRVRFNYLKTIGANITGSFNQSDLLQLKEIFNRGITIWHYNKDNFNYLDYSYENMEVSLL